MVVEVNDLQQDFRRWEDSMVGVDSVEYPLSKNVAWVASNADDSLLNPPDLDNSSVSVVFPDNTTAHQQITNNNGWHLTSSAFDGAGIGFSAPDSQWGHYLESVADEKTLQMTITVGGGNYTNGMKLR